ncbi:hypothetical protein ACPW96_19345 [Micromonospora sp. DT81.3]|uniref:hypothetical protein n=1 Tax=Micromonospora sp. DT81.3 TaxID=3416523 RepID=UPI003CF85492
MTTSAPLRRRRPWGSPLVIVGFAVLYIVVGGLLLWRVPEPLLQNWLPGSTVEERGKLLGTAAQIVLFGLGGVIAIVGVSLSLSRHRQELEANERDDQRHADDREKEAIRRSEVQLQRRVDAERELRTRFVTAVDLLSAQEPIKRIAAIYALAALADDWDAHGRPDEVQVCIDVICGYLRSPLPEGITTTPPLETAVKVTAVGMIAARLRDGANHSWCEKEINLERATLDFPVVLDGATINRLGSVSLDEAVISGNGYVRLDGLTINDGGRVSLKGATVRERLVSLTGGTINAGVLTMAGIVVDGGTVGLHKLTINSGGLLAVHLAEIFGRDANLDLALIAINEGGRVSGSGVIVRDKGAITASMMTVDGGRLELDDMRVDVESTAALVDVRVQAGEMSMEDLTVRGAVALGPTTINGAGTVSLDRMKIVETGGVATADVRKWFAQPMTINGEGTFSLKELWIDDDGKLALKGLKINDGGQVLLTGLAIFNKGTVALDGATLSMGGQVEWAGASSTDDGPVVLDNGVHITPMPAVSPVGDNAEFGPNDYGVDPG